MSSNCECISVLPWVSRGEETYVLWNRLTFVQCEDSCFVTQWNERQMTTLQVHVKEVRDVTVSLMKSATQLCQDVNFPETVSQVFEWSGKLFLLAGSGFLKVLKFDTTTISYLRKGTGCFKTIFSLPPPKIALKAYPLNGNVLLIATSLNGHISLDIYNVDTSSDEMGVFLIDSIPLEKQGPQDGTASAVMCTCSLSIVSQLIGTQSDHYCIILVGLNSGSVFWLPFIKDAPVVPEARKLYHAGRKVQDIVSLKGDNNKVFALLEGGVVISIASSKVKNQNMQKIDRSSRSLQFDTIALPGSVRAFCFSSNSDSILCSDGIQCWLVREATNKAETILLPLNGVTAFLALPETDICLATTKHNTFYSINLASDFSRLGSDESEIQKCCDLETPCQYIMELKEKTNELLEVEAALKVEDSVLAGISTAARGNILRNSFSGRVLVYNVDTLDLSNERAAPSVDTLYKLSVEVKNTSNTVFPAILWNMSIAVVTRDRGVLSKTVPLPNAFCHSVPFSSHVYVRLRGIDLVSDPKVMVTLIAELPDPDHGRWISIPVLEEELDLSYFVTVISDTDKSASQSIAVPIEVQVDQLVGQESMIKQRSATYLINIPQELRDVGELMNGLLSKCRHRCEDFLKHIKGGTDQREFNLLFGDTVVTLSFNRTVSVLTITSTNVEIVHAAKRWVIRTLAKSDASDLTSSDIVCKAKWLRSVLEKEQLKPSLDANHLSEIHSEVRNNLSAALPL